MSDYIVCSHEGCEASVPNHRWGVTKAGPEWFFQRSGESWCPLHHPEWVKEWRARKSRRERQGI